MRVRTLLFSILALAAVGGADPAMGQGGDFVVDGDPDGLGRAVPLSTSTPM